MNAPKDLQVNPERHPCFITGVTMDFAATIAVIITRPLVHLVTHGGMGQMTPPIALPLIGIEPRAARRDVVRNQRRAGAPSGMVAHPEALLTRVPRDDANKRPYYHSRHGRYT